MGTTGNFIKTGPDHLFENKFRELNHRKFIYFFLAFCLVLIAITFNHPIGDFGNYYYGSKFFRQGIDPLKLYQDIHFFNRQIKIHETGIFFENYAPVPPFSLVFYWPFTFFNLMTAKLIFNLLGLAVFCFSFQRLMRTLQTFSWSFYLLPVIFFQPLYSNFHHGQTYLFIAALLFEFCIAWKNDRKITLGMIIAFLFALKIFPALIAIVFVLKKDWKAIGWAAFFIGIVCLISCLFIGKETINYYYLEVFPRLAVNDITEPFSKLNQSVYTFLLNGFVFQPNLNPAPFFNSTILAVVVFCLFCSLVFSFLVRSVLKHELFVSFFISLLALALLNKYSTVYGMVAFLPVIFLVKEIPAKKMVLICFLMFLACNVPIYKLNSLPLFFQYPRPWLLLFIFLLLIQVLKVKFDLKYFAVGLLIFVAPSLVFYKYKTDNLPEFRPKAGAVYDFEVSPSHIKIFTCAGNRDTIEVFDFGSNNIDSTTFKTTNPLNKKAVFVNNKNLVVMSDKNTGVGLYYVKLINPESEK